jgi:hypothetical protein
MTTPPTKQWELRADLHAMIEDYLLELGISEVYNVIDDLIELNDKGITKAIFEYNEQMTKTLKQLSRIVARLGYLDKE